MGLNVCELWQADQGKQNFRNWLKTERKGPELIQ